jgi:hypothetical protein
MNLSDCITHCKAMVGQNNGNYMLPITEEDEVIENSSTTRSFKKYDVWVGPHGEQQIWSVCFADVNNHSTYSIWTGGYSTPSGPAKEIGVVFMDKNGVCRAMSAMSIDYSWRKVNNPDIYWTNHWAKVMHDIRNGVSRTKPDTILESYGLLQAGQTVLISDPGTLSNGARGKILSFITYKNTYGFHTDALVVVGDLNRKDHGHFVPTKAVSVVPDGSFSKNVDKKDKDGDNDSDLMLKFFASSQHDPSNPWYKDYKDKGRK